MSASIQTLTSFLQDEQVLLVLLTFGLGLFVGSFLNVVVHRLPIILTERWSSTQSLNLCFPSSQCPACHRPIPIFEKIPVLSYLILRGNCQGCRTPIAIRYPLVELITGILSAYVCWRFGWRFHTLCGLLLTWALITLSFIDLETELLPDDITLPLLWTGLMINLFLPIAPVEDALLGACFGYLSLWSVYWIYKLITGKEGFGYGDFKLLAAMGAWMGWQCLPFIIVASSALGAAVGIGLITLKKMNHESSMPFGPYLAIAGWLYYVI